MNVIVSPRKSFGTGSMVIKEPLIGMSLITGNGVGTGVTAGLKGIGVAGIFGFSVICADLMHPEIPSIPIISSSMKGSLWVFIIISRN